MQKPEVLNRLKEHLQTALLLELSTMPPYLCAMWSIHGSSRHALQTKNFILSIVQEEMLHLAMVCNILNAVGGKPIMNNPDLLPCFPCALPGHSKTADPFIVRLNKCCPDTLKTFLKIELPGQFFLGNSQHDGWCTIGEFYSEIESLINHPSLSDDDFSYGKQVGNNVNPAKGILYEVRSRADALKALEEIIDQGEGHSGKMYDKDHQLTHYWKFKAIYELIENGLWDFQNEVYDMAPDPHDDFFSEEVKKLSDDFNKCWTSLLDELTDAFSNETPDMEKSIGIMFKLKQPAVALMQLPLKGRKGNAGPMFRYV